MITKNIIGVDNVINFLKTEDLSNIDKVYAEYKDTETDTTHLLVEVNDVNVDIYKVCLNLKYTNHDDTEDIVPIINNIKMHLLAYGNIMRIRGVSRTKQGDDDKLVTTITHLFAISKLRIEDDDKLIFY